MNTYLVYLEWPEKCFRVDAEALRLLRRLVPRGSRIIRATDDSSFLENLPRATHVVTWHFDAGWFPLAGRLRLLATPAAGRELVPSRGPSGVRIHFGAFHGAIMAESVVGFMLAWARGFFRPERSLVWGRPAMGGACYLVAGTKAVIVGYGNVGKAIGEKLSALGASVFGYSRRRHVPERIFESRLREADWLILALPSDTGTDNFLDSRLIAKLSRQCVVINVGRGNAVDEKALLAALEGGRIAGAYLDVFKGEPGEWSKRFSERLLLNRRKLPWNLVKMPHTSAFCCDYIQRCFQELRDDGCL